jgi:hypothetical protein
LKCRFNFEVKQIVLFAALFVSVGVISWMVPFPRPKQPIPETTRGTTKQNPGKPMKNEKWEMENGK